MAILGFRLEHPHAKPHWDLWRGSRLHESIYTETLTGLKGVVLV